MAERLFDRLAAAPGEAVLLRQGERVVTAAQVREAMAELDRLIGTGEHRVVAVLADNGPEAALVDLAALRAGIAHLPLPGFFTAAQWRHAVETSGVTLAFVEHPGALLDLDAGFRIAGRWRTLHVLKRHAKDAALPAHTAKISFTSGSTGTSRGACLSAVGIIDTAEAVGHALEDLPIARHLAVLPLPLLLENVAGLYGALLRGAEVHLPSLQRLGWRGMQAFDAASLDREVRAAAASSAILVPEVLKRWSHHLRDLDARADASLAFVAVGGARVDPALLDDARAAGIPAYEGYGLTECGSVVTLNRPGCDRRASAGMALAHVDLSIAASGEIGVVQRVFLGYLGDTCVPPCPWPTGDAGYLDGDGFLHLSGRIRNVLITAYGRNVAPEWVEAALTAQPEIAQAIVVGEAKPVLGALVVASPGVPNAAVRRAIARANGKLPGYARVGPWAQVAPFDCASGLATGNGRPLRAAVLARHAQTLQSLYATKEPQHVHP